MQNSTIDKLLEIATNALLLAYFLAQQRADESKSTQ